ncbi:MAG: extracellular solute-binding protein, partial [Pseudomonadales bacterium]|nr:extracellular solute-binding protein [Pseudomonadales bacterium]
MLKRLLLLTLVLSGLPAFAQDGSRVVVMSSYPQELIARYETAFETAHPGIDMVLEWRRSDDARQLLQSGNPGVDVYWAPSLDTFVTLADAGYFAELPLPFAGLPGNIDELEIDDPAHRFAAFEVAGFGFAFSPAWLDVHELSVPQDWQDLRDPRYSGAVQLPIPSRQGFSPMIYASILRGLGWEQGWGLIGDIAANNSLMGGGGGAFIDELAAGNLGLAL